MVNARFVNNKHCQQYLITNMWLLKLRTVIWQHNIQQRLQTFELNCKKHFNQLITLLLYQLIIFKISKLHFIHKNITENLTLKIQQKSVQTTRCVHFMNWVTAFSQQIEIWKQISMSHYVTYDARKIALRNIY